jgi:hypothetical protein
MCDRGHVLEIPWVSRAGKSFDQRRPLFPQREFAAQFPLRQPVARLIAKVMHLCLNLPETRQKGVLAGSQLVDDPHRTLRTFAAYNHPERWPWKTRPHHRGRL